MKSIYPNFSVKASTTTITYRFASTISLTLLCFSSALLVINKTSAQTPDNTNLEQTAVTSISNAVSTLIEVLRSENVEARVNAARALGGMGTQAKIAEPALKIALYDKEPRVRYSAAIAIANLGGDTKDAFPELLKALEDESKWIRQDAAYALSNIALNLQGEVRDLSAEELNQAVTNFENTLKIMEDSKLEIPPQAMKSINDSLDSLKREKQRQ